MRLLTSIQYGLAMVAAGLAAGAAEAQAPPPCRLPPPMVCPPPPPPGMGPRLIDSMKAYVDELDRSVESMTRAQEEGWSPAAKAEIDAYEGDLKHHRDLVADWVDRVSPESGRNVAAEAVHESGGPE